MKKYLIKYTEKGFSEEGYIEAESMNEAVKKFAAFKSATMKFLAISPIFDGMFKNLKKIC